MPGYVRPLATCSILVVVIVVVVVVNIYPSFHRVIAKNRTMESPDIKLSTVANVGTSTISPSL
jgi:hypothetical protein